MLSAMAPVQQNMDHPDCDAEPLTGASSLHIVCTSGYDLGRTSYVLTALHTDLICTTCKSHAHGLVKLGSGANSDD